MTGTIEIFYWPTPNGHKITIACEEMGLPYKITPVNIGRGEQFKPAFLALSPNNRMPAIVDHDGPDGQPISVFESGAILIYLAEKTGLRRALIRRARLLMNLPPQYQEIILSELQKPKALQVLTEDYFIEMERALTTVERCSVACGWCFRGAFFRGVGKRSVGACCGVDGGLVARLLLGLRARGRQRQRDDMDRQRNVESFHGTFLKSRFGCSLRMRVRARYAWWELLPEPLASKPCQWAPWCDIEADVMHLCTWPARKHPPESAANGRSVNHRRDVRAPQCAGRPATAR